MKHNRGFLLLCQCSDCAGTGRIEIVIRGRADAVASEVVCAECGGSGEVMVTARDADFGELQDGARS